MSSDVSRYVNRECPVCGTIYEADRNRLKHGRQTTCSRSCSYEFRAQKMRDRIQLECSTCGEQFSRVPSHVKSKHDGVYCSRECHYTGRTLGYTKRVVNESYDIVKPLSPAERTAAAKKAWATRRRNGNDTHSEDTIRRLREATTRAIAEGDISRISKLEDEVSEVLNRLGLTFDRQIGLRDSQGRYCAVLDFLIEGTALEVNGTFWHADPRVYPDGPEHASQRRTAACWDRKMDILRRREIPLAVVWEADIREDATQAVRVALSSPIT